MALSTEEILGLLTLIGLTIETIRRLLKEVFTTKIETLLLTKGNQMQRLFIIVLVFAFLLLITFSMLTSIVVELFFELTLLEIPSLIIISVLAYSLVITPLFLGDILKFKNTKVLNYAVITFFHIILAMFSAILIAFLFYYSIDKTDDTSAGLTSLILGLFVIWISASRCFFICYYKAKGHIIKLNVVTRIMTEQERIETFSSGMYISYSIQPDIQFVKPSPNHYSESFPQYLYYTSTDKVHIFEEGEQKNPQLKLFSFPVKIK